MSNPTDVAGGVGEVARGVAGTESAVVDTTTSTAVTPRPNTEAECTEWPPCDEGTFVVPGLATREVRDGESS